MTYILHINYIQYYIAYGCNLTIKYMAMLYIFLLSWPTDRVYKLYNC